MSDKQDMLALAAFFRDEAPDFGRQGDHEGWSPEETAMHFLRQHKACHTPEPDWNAILSHIGFELRIALSRHPKISNSLTLGEGDKLIGELASKLTYDVRKCVDPSYDQ